MAAERANQTMGTFDRANMANLQAGPEGRKLPRDQAWPELPLELWHETRDTLHRYTQVVGKIRLAQEPFEPQWQNVPLYVNARGLTTGPVPYGDIAFEVAFDFIDHQLVMTASDEGLRRLELAPRSVSDFYHEVLEALEGLGISLRISDIEVEIPNPVPFSRDHIHDSYDPESVGRFFRVLSRVDQVLKQWRSRYWGKASPVVFWWGSFDLSTARLSGRHVDPPPKSDVIYRYGMDAEEVACGFWPGDERYAKAAFYAYAYPKPDGMEQANVLPAAARWNTALGEHVLDYDDVRLAKHPEATILAFFDSVYDAAASLAEWDREKLEVHDIPPPVRRSLRRA